MFDGTHALIAAAFLFVGGHFLLSGNVLRTALRRRFGAQGFRVLYSIAMIAAFLWMLAAYRNAPFQQVWTPAPVFAWVPLLVMPIAAILAVAGLTTPSPTLVGGERFLDGAPGTPAVGILTITRHPFLWGTGLWAVSHLLVNGDLTSMVMMGGIAILSFGGMVHIDQRREASLGAAWGPMKLTTSLVPFGAILTGRAKLDWRGIGWWRPALGLVAYLALLHLHASFLGVSPLPA